MNADIIVQQTIDIATLEAIFLCINCNGDAHHVAQTLLLFYVCKSSRLLPAAMNGGSFKTV
jgi:hypothetical protein